MEVDFMECSTCASRPGAPVLCRACLNNRNLILRMKADLKGYVETNMELGEESRKFQGALLRYGRHDHGCGNRTSPRVCTCGLERLREEAGA